MFAQSSKRVALDCVKDAEPSEVLREDFLKPEKGCGQSRFVKEVLRGAETPHAFQKNVSFTEHGSEIGADEIRSKNRGSVAEEL
jgi:hypothetical protein